MIPFSPEEPVKPTRVVVRIICKCGNQINIRTVGNRASVLCWKCNREVGFEMRGWMKANGYYVDEGRRYSAETIVVSQEST